METVRAVKERSKQKRQGAIIAELRASPAIRIVELALEHDVVLPDYVIGTCGTGTYPGHDDDGRLSPSGQYGAFHLVRTANIATARRLIVGAGGRWETTGVGRAPCGPSASG